MKLLIRIDAFIVVSRRSIILEEIVVLGKPCTLVTSCSAIVAEVGALQLFFMASFTVLLKLAHRECQLVCPTALPLIVVGDSPCRSRSLIPAFRALARRIDRSITVDCGVRGTPARLGLPNPGCDGLGLRLQLLQRLLLRIPCIPEV